MKGIKTAGLVLASAAAALLASGYATANTHHHHAKEVECSGANACKGKSDCKTADNQCKGNNACKGKGVKHMKSAEECKKAGGKVVEEHKKDRH